MFLQIQYGSYELEIVYIVHYDENNPHHTLGNN